MLFADNLIQLFILFQQEDEKLLAHLRSHNPVAIQDNQWHFRLDELHICYQYYYPLLSVDYLTFRKKLFNSPINERLRAMGWCIQIAKNTGHIDQSIYYLSPLNSLS
ncbi:MAG: hypothetical protein HRU05_01725 [Oceanospirillaceae bacterium]|nr:hypothetical protein [Oceanospirillaceae bacterium]